MGRPRQGVPEGKAKSVLEWIASGRTLREWCRIPGNPCFTTVYDWKDKDQEFSLRFARAREIGEWLIAEECLEIADTPQLGEIVTKKADGSTETKIADMIEHRKLQIDTRLKLLAKWNPKKYSQQLNSTHSGKVTLEELVCGDGSSD